jgi:hypothetical protein
MMTCCYSFTNLEIKFNTSIIKGINFDYLIIIKSASRLYSKIFEISFKPIANYS